jgi:hypothetical protein
VSRPADTITRRGKSHLHRLECFANANLGGVHGRPFHFADLTKLLQDVMMPMGWGLAPNWNTSAMSEPLASHGAGGLTNTQADVRRVTIWLQRRCAV